MTTATDHHEDTVSVPEAGRRLELPTREVYERIRRGELPIVREDGMFRVPLSELTASEEPGG